MLITLSRRTASCRSLVDREVKATDLIFKILIYMHWIFTARYDNHYKFTGKEGAYVKNLHTLILQSTV